MKTVRYQKLSIDGDSERVSYFSFLFFQWMNNIFKKGSEGTLEESDFMPLSRERSTEFFTNRLQQNWIEEKADRKGNKQRPRLWKSVIKMISLKDAMVIVLLYVISLLWRLSRPLFLGYLIYSLMNDAEPQKSLPLYGCVMAMGICAFIGVSGVHHFSYQCDLYGIGISSALKGLIYQKILRLNKTDILKFTTGHVIDLVSNDVQRLEDHTVLWGCSAILDFLLLIPIIVVLLMYFIGWQALMGVTSLFFLLPYFAGLSYVFAALRLRTATFSDRRISLLNQVISGIRAIKTHALEDEFREKIKRVRRDEINIIRKKSVALSAVAALEFTAVPLAMLVSIITLVLTGQPLTPLNVFMLLSFINAARQSVCFYVPYGLLGVYEAYFSLKRMEDFFLLEDLPESCHNHSIEGTLNTAESISKFIETVSNQRDRTVAVPSAVVRDEEDLPQLATLEVFILASKEKIHDDDFILQDVEFSLDSQTLTVITGPVGSGKSTLLSAIAGEVSVAAGTINCPFSLVYVPQIPWIYSGTIRQNILFGQVFNQDKYNRILEACSLTHDVRTFPNGDQTVVGELGAVLSGGQRARVSLARAVYMDADLYLLDDPLSAVDMKVSQHIFQKCIKELLSTKTRVLTSHKEQHMKEADRVIVLFKGRVLANGTFSELQEKSLCNTNLDVSCKKPVWDKISEVRFVAESENESEFKERAMIPQHQVKDLEISEEDCTIGSVTLMTYWDYFRSGLHTLAIVGLVCLFFIAQVMIVSPDVWLSFLTKKSKEEQKDKFNFIFYGCLVLGSLIFSSIRAYAFLRTLVRCSQRLHDKMVVAVVEAPVLFFDSNPVGRILNRFSKDVGYLDELLPKTFLTAIQLTLLISASTVVPTFTNPWVLFAVVPLAIIAVYISMYSLKTSRQLKRLESINRSPVFSHVSETLNGLETIRTRRREREFVEDL
ncbi:multidrug resistance-associated protein 4-like [Stylophora pistillata]|uniref:multidrug resistance-associated protein 4-like n=1 Tax=Stylophora pistillata TaxID=50429 RepID=UPI000C03D2CB|nr:multidrug resistance-associated protein 4-like [Stylophora pistillata]